MLRTIALAIAIAVAAPLGLPQGDAQEADLRAIGPTIGAPAPKLEGRMIDGSAVSLDDLNGEAGVALVFFRSASWCPYCQKQLVDLKEAAAPLSAMGWNIVGVSYDSPDTLQTFADTKSLNFPLISDENSATITSFGLLNSEYQPGSRAYGIPHPAIVFVRSDGIVAAVLREEGYRTRPPVDAVLSTAELVAPAAS